MILVNVMVQGEPDTKPFFKTFQHQSKSDESIFFESAKLVQGRILRNLRININETITIFTAYIVTELRAGKTITEIQKHASEILSPEKVLIGVPESLRMLTFTVALDNIPKQVVTLNTPIPIFTYFLEDAKMHDMQQVR